MTGANGVRCDAVKSFKPNNKSNTYKDENGGVADDELVHYARTVGDLQKFGFNSYRMSISWPRVMSYSMKNGNLTSVVNQQGISYYLRVLNALASANIDVALTLWHWDTPEALENYAYAQPACMVPNATTGSFWLCPHSDEIFLKYATLIIQHYGEWSSSQQSFAGSA